MAAHTDNQNGPLINTPINEREQSEDGGLELGSLIATWWRKRVQLLLLAGAGGIVSFAILAAVFVMRPTTQESTVVFRLLFKGAEKGYYPNGMRFTPADIISTPVLEEVYRRDHLEKFLPFEQFKNSFAVINRNPALERLHRAYVAILEDRKLSPVERQKAEDEYESKTRALLNGEFTLVAASNIQSVAWPAEMVGKVMEDILNVWAEQSRSRGIFLFDFGIFSENILDEIQPAKTDYTILQDRIRLTINRVLGNLKDLSAVPGAQLVRVGDQKVSINEIDAALRDYQDFALREINALINTFSLFHDRTISEAYLKEQIFRLDLKTKELQSRNDGIQRVLADYNSLSRAGVQGNDNHTGGTSSTGGGLVSPQLSDSFLDRIVSMSGQNAEVVFRQDLSRQMVENEGKMVEIATDRQLYQRSVDALERGNNSAVNATQASTVVDTKIAELLIRIRQAMRNVMLLHKEISEQNLQPSQIYTVVQPLSQQNLSTVSMRLPLMGMVFLYVIYLGLIMLALAWRESFART